MKKKLNEGDNFFIHSEPNPRGADDIKAYIVYSRIATLGKGLESCHIEYYTCSQIQYKFSTPKNCF